MSEQSNHVSFVEIENFKSIKKLRLDTKRINILIGKPNVGKSNILEAISLLGATYADIGKYSNKVFSQFIRYEKFKNLFFDSIVNNKIKVETKASVCEITYGKKNYQELFHVLLLKDKSQINKVFFFDGELDNINEIYSNGDIKNYSVLLNINNEGHSVDFQTGLGIHSNPFKKYDFNSSVKYYGDFSSFVTPPFGENLIAVLMNYTEIRKEVAPFFKEYGLDLLIDTEKNQLEIQKKIDDLSYKIPYSLTADTLRRIIFYLTAILSNKNSVIMLEEPEAHAFPPYVNMLAQRIVDSTTNQFFIATHSPYLLHKIIEEAEEGEVALFHIDYKDYQTTATLISDEEITKIYENGVDIFFNIL